MNEIRNMRISARITPNLYKKISKWAKEKKWSVSTTVEAALVILLTSK